MQQLSNKESTLINCAFVNTIAATNPDLVPALLGWMDQLGDHFDLDPVEVKRAKDFVSEMQRKTYIRPVH